MRSEIRQQPRLILLNWPLNRPLKKIEAAAAAAAAGACAAAAAWCMNAKERVA
jgi:hypothetical protein